MASLFKRLLALSISILAVNSTFIPRTDEGSSTLSGILDPNISLSFKETHICETTPGVKSYSGYVNIPADPTEGRNYDSHTFFWFFESRKDPANAPLSLWLQGGPGSPSMTAALGENGPCLVAPNSEDTVLNPWSWNNEVNMLYIDQPVQTGFSYDRLINGTIDEFASPFAVTPQESLDSAELSNTVLAGIFSSQDPLSTANTTLNAARAAWHFMQIWMTEFPIYKPNDNKFSIWSESYGGHYGPTFSDFFESQNELIANGTLDSSSVLLHLETVGIVNGCLDILTQMPLYPVMAFNNTYGLQIINETTYQTAMDAWPTCQSMIEECQSLAAANDPLGTGTNADVNTACYDANQYCFLNMWQPYNATGRNVFDITSYALGAFPPKYAAGFLNTKETQDDLGVPLNFTGQSAAASKAFGLTGDFVLGRSLAILGELLDRGVKVALVYGDRDFNCNWLGGEQISLAIESKISADFQKAGYAEIKTNETYVGGMVRQFGNLSFSRVFNAGHEVPWYQPETAYEIFKRVMSDKDVATGETSTKVCSDSQYSTTGIDNVFGIKNELPPAGKQECYFWDMLETCTKPQKLMVQNGTAILQDFIMIGYESANGTAVYY